MKADTSASHRHLRCTTGHAYILCVFVFMWTVNACGRATNHDTTSTHDPDLVRPTGLELAQQGFGQDPYEIGAKWYDYDGLDTHAIIPRDHVYLVQRLGTSMLLKVDTYYDDRGTSGFFTLSTKTWKDGSWGAMTRVVFDENIKDAPVCLALGAWQQVPCTHEDVALIFRTQRRPIPELGVSVSEPAIYTKTHFTAPESKTLVTTIVTARIEDIAQTPMELRTNYRLRPSSASDPVHSRVGWIQDASGTTPRQDINLHMTASNFLSQWRLRSITSHEDAAQDTLTLHAQILCQAINFTAQRPFEANSKQQEYTLNIDTSKPYNLTLVRLCDEETGEVAFTVTSKSNAPFFGMWPDTRDYDLIVEQWNGRISVRVAPGNNLWNWTRSQKSPSQEFEPIDITTMWEEWNSWSFISS